MRLAAYITPNGLGLGHATRMLRVGRELKQRGWRVRYSSYEDGLRYLRAQKCDVVAAPAFQLQHVGRAISSERMIPRITNVEVLRFFQRIGFEIREMRQFKPNVVLSDTRATSLIAAKLLGIPRIAVLTHSTIFIPRSRRMLRAGTVGDGAICTVLRQVWQLANAIVVPDLPPPYTIAEDNLPNLPRRQTVKYVGGLVDVQRPLPCEREPLIFVPISGPIEQKKGLARRILEELRPLVERFRIVFCAGVPGASSTPRRISGVEYYAWLGDQERLALFYRSAVVVCRGGHGTLLHALLNGAPVVGIPAPGQTEQYNNLRKIERLGAGRLVPESRLEDLRDAVEEVASNDAYAKRAAELASVQDDMPGVAGVVEEVERLAL
ncbi:hypothetical protein DRN94_003640 [archaeon]|nr:hypothetical protein [archaeon]